PAPIGYNGRAVIAVPAALPAANDPVRANLGHGCTDPFGDESMVTDSRGRHSTGVDSAPNLDFSHIGPGTLAGRYLRTFWQPVYLAHELPPGHAKPIRTLGEDFTLYRGEDGAPHLL